MKILERLWCLSKIVRLSDTELMLNVGHCTLAVSLWLGELCRRQQAGFGNIGLRAGGSCCSEGRRGGCCH